MELPCHCPHCPPPELWLWRSSIGLRSPAICPASNPDSAPQRRQTSVWHPPSSAGERGADVESTETICAAAALLTPWAAEKIGFFTMFFSTGCTRICSSAWSTSFFTYLWVVKVVSFTFSHSCSPQATKSLLCIPNAVTVTQFCLETFILS